MSAAFPTLSNHAKDRHWQQQHNDYGTQFNGYALHANETEPQVCLWLAEKVNCHVMIFCLCSRKISHNWRLADHLPKGALSYEKAFFSSKAIPQRQSSAVLHAVTRLWIHIIQSLSCSHYLWLNAHVETYSTLWMSRWLHGACLVVSTLLRASLFILIKNHKNKFIAADLRNKTDTFSSQDFSPIKRFCAPLLSVLPLQPEALCWGPRWKQLIGAAAVVL